jgi:hypothetical protein
MTTTNKTSVTIVYFKGLPIRIYLDEVSGVMYFCIVDFLVAAYDDERLYSKVRNNWKQQKTNFKSPLVLETTKSVYLPTSQGLRLTDVAPYITLFAICLELHCKFSDDLREFVLGLFSRGDDKLRRSIVRAEKKYAGWVNKYGLDWAITRSRGVLDRNIFTSYLKKFGNVPYAAITNRMYSWSGFSSAKGFLEYKKKANPPGKKGSSNLRNCMRAQELAMTSLSETMAVAIGYKMNARTINDLNEVIEKTNYITQVSAKAYMDVVGESVVSPIDTSINTSLIDDTDISID